MIKNSFLFLSNIMIKRIPNISMFIILLGINTKVFATYYYRPADDKSALVLTEEKRGQCVVVAENNLDVKIENVMNELRSHIKDLNNKIDNVDNNLNVKINNLRNRSRSDIGTDIIIILVTVLISLSVYLFLNKM
ncbi:hypothetical protein bcCo53_001089 (plasmid) [Borrelia coriaceae]|nr:hypothetical protein [Borrelia coriaceae]UPA16922.1 hypothetical protein bcCo53_001089 [Borrelia coriaceae]